MGRFRKSGMPVSYFENCRCPACRHTMETVEDTASARPFVTGGSFVFLPAGLIGVGVTMFLTALLGGDDG